MSVLNAGCRELDVIDKQSGAAIPLLAFYPAVEIETPRSFGPYAVEAAWAALVAPGQYPLVLISHGSGGSHLTLRTLAQFLARNGWIVLTLQHPRNNRNRNDLAGTAEILENRPRHLRVVVDWVFAEFASSLTGAVAVIGHSLGGYTGLAIAGGKPRSFSWEAADGIERPIHVVADDRVNALVLLAPATVWFRRPSALDGVHVPVLMLTGDKDPVTPPFHAEIVKLGVKSVEHQIIPNADHFSFLSPFPASMQRPEFPPSQDSAGFDRAAFHREMNLEILNFLLRSV